MAGHNRSSISRRIGVRLAAAAATAVAASSIWLGAAPPPAMDPVREWNLIAAARTLAATPALAPVAQVRAMSIVQVAVHDAVNAITGEFETYQGIGPVGGGLSAEAAAIGAAHAALLGVFPAQAASINASLATSLPTHGIDPTDPGLAFGAEVAGDVLALRATDGASTAQYVYTAPGAGQPGVWVPLGTQTALLAGWGDVTPWVLESSDQFMAEPPPPLRSAQYARDYNEVKRIGALASPYRTQTQTDIAFFWRGSPTAIWNPVIDQILAARNLSISENARALALMYVAGTDSGIACWEIKYRYDFWRPQPAINRGAEDGNPSTAPDPAWVPLLPTPPHPEYVSGHTTNSSAMAAILSLLFGDDPGITMSVTLTGITREWDTFTEAVDEVVNARIYSGIHFRTADEVGTRIGGQVARFVYTHALRETHGSSK